MRFTVTEDEPKELTEPESPKGEIIYFKHINIQHLFPTNLHATYIDYFSNKQTRSFKIIRFLFNI